VRDRIAGSEDNNQGVIFLGSSGFRVGRSHRLWLGSSIRAYWLVGLMAFLTAWAIALLGLAAKAMSR